MEELSFPLVFPKWKKLYFISLIMKVKFQHCNNNNKIRKENVPSS